MQPRKEAYRPFGVGAEEQLHRFTSACDLASRAVRGTIGLMANISHLADYSVAAWVMDKPNWRFVFDSSDGEATVQHELIGVLHWQISSLRDGIGVSEIGLKLLQGSVATDASARGLLWRALGLTDQASDSNLRRRVEDLSGTVIYTIDTVCGESIDVICAEVRETVIKERVSYR